MQNNLDRGRPYVFPVPRQKGAMTESGVVLMKRVEGVISCLNSFLQNNTRFCHRALLSGNWKHVCLPYVTNALPTTIANGIKLVVSLPVVGMRARRGITFGGMFVEIN